MVGAYVLINTEPGMAGEVIASMSDIEGIKTVNAVTGPFDAIVYAEVPDFTDIGSLVVSKIQKTNGVSKTLTCITVPL